MAENLDFKNLKIKENEINKQLDGLISSIVENQIKSEESIDSTDTWNESSTNSELNTQASNNSFDDETETFESLEYKLNDENEWCDSDNENLPSSNESLSGNEETYELDQQQFKNSDLKYLSETIQNEYIKRINELEEEVKNLKEIFGELTKNLKTEVANIIFNQFNVLEKEFKRSN